MTIPPSVTNQTGYQVGQKPPPFYQTTQDDAMEGGI